MMMCDQPDNTLHFIFEQEGAAVVKDIILADSDGRELGAILDSNITVDTNGEYEFSVQGTDTASGLPSMHLLLLSV